MLRTCAWERALFDTLAILMWDENEDVPIRFPKVNHFLDILKKFNAPEAYIIIIVKSFTL